MTANPGGGDYVSPGRKFLHGDWRPEPDPLPRPFVPAPDGWLPLYVQQAVLPFPSAIEKAQAMGEFAERATQFLLSQGADWRTVQFEIDHQGTQPYGELWRWKAWRAT